MRKILSQIRQYFISLRKFGNDISDLFKPKNDVTIILRCPKTGDVLKSIKGRNIITSFLLSSTGYPAYRSGTDVMRRLLIDPNDGSYGSESLQNPNGASTGVYIKFMEFGIGNTPESSSDKGLATPIGYNNTDSGGNYVGIANYSTTTEPNARKTVSMNTGSTSILATSATDVTFIGEWSSAELNGQQLSEIALVTSADASANKHFFARKTFTPFTKTSEFTLEIRWTIRF